MRNYVAFIALNVCCFLSCAALAFAAPPLVRYQGQAVDAQGIPLEGPYSLTFRLYPAAIGGTPLWEEVQLAVPLTRGLFSVLLGQQTSLVGVDWSQPLWLGVQINQDPELAPRQQIASVPMAIRAETADTMKTSGLTDDMSRLVPPGAIILWSGAACPANYTRMSILDGKFIVGGQSFETAAGGSNTHAHDAGSYTSQSHTHSVPHNGWTSNGSGTDMSILAMGKGGEDFARPTTHNVSGSGGALPILGSSGSVDSRPEFATVLLCQKD